LTKNLVKLLRSFGWRVKYVPHKIIKEYNACYRVVYHGKVISPPAAEKLGIPLNEICLSERLRGFEEYVLFHELREIEYRYQGYSVKDAHFLARIDEALRFCSDQKWIDYFKRFPDYTIPLNCLQKLCEMIGRSVRDKGILYKLVLKCISSY